LHVAGPSEVTGSYLKGFDLKTGQGKVSAKLPGAKRSATTSPSRRTAALCHQQPRTPDPEAERGPDRLRRLRGNPLFDPPAQGGAGLDGIAFGADGNLYVDKFSEAGLLRVAIEAVKPGR
jgi:hypothetical protein